MNHNSWIEERHIIQWPNDQQAWFIWPLYYLSFLCSWLVVHLAIALSVFLLFMTCGSFNHCIICLSSIHDLWFIWPLQYNGQMNHNSWIEEREIMQWPNEPQFMNRIKTDNAVAKWTTSHVCLSSIHDFWFILPLYYLSFFYSLFVVHLPIVLSVFLLCMAYGSFDHCIICLSYVKDR
jgi:hypothetical protein